jgi:hypothetical protein
MQDRRISVSRHAKREPAIFALIKVGIADDHVCPWACCFLWLRCCQDSGSRIGQVLSSFSKLCRDCTLTVGSAPSGSCSATFRIVSYTSCCVPGVFGMSVTFGADRICSGTAK